MHYIHQVDFKDLAYFCDRMVEALGTDEFIKLVQDRAKALEVSQECLSEIDWIEDRLKERIAKEEMPE